MEEYERRADEFLQGPLREGARECTRSNGDLLRFDPATEEFGTLAPEGYIRTYMILRPLPYEGTPLQYFESNCRQ